MCINLSDNHRNLSHNISVFNVKVVLDSNLMKGEAAYNAGKEKGKAWTIRRCQWSSVQTNSTANNSAVCWLFQITILLISLLWLTRWTGADKVVRKWNDAHFFSLHKGPFEVAMQCYLRPQTDAQRMALNNDEPAALIARQCPRGKYITNEFYREKYGHSLLQ